MTAGTKIEWANETWNPLAGCSLASTGCANCYAIKECWRLAHNPNPKVAAKFAGTVRKTKAGQLVWTGKVNFSEEALLLPLRWKKPRRIFVNSLSDLFHESVSDETIDRIFAVMALCPQHQFLVLTKRSARMREYFGYRGTPDRIYHLACDMIVEEMLDVIAIAPGIDESLAPEGKPRVYLGQWPIPNVWLGVSVENQQAADERIPDLLATPAAIRWLSCEPLVAPVDVRKWTPECYECGLTCGLRLPGPPEIERCTECGEECGPDTDPVISDGCPKCGGELECVCPDCGHYMVHEHPDTPCIDWVVAGGESGAKARPANPQWFRNLRDQCAAADVSFFFKQWGEWVSVSEVEGPQTDWHTFDDHRSVRRVGKKAAVRTLDGELHDAFPGGRH